MQSIPLLHASQAMPFIHFIERVGSPVRRLLEASRLPPKMLDDQSIYVPENNVWSLLDRVADLDGIPELGLLVGRELRLQDLGSIGVDLEYEPTLLAALERFCRLVNSESTHAGFWLERTCTGVRFIRRGVPGIDAAQFHIELYTLQLMQRIVQSAAGPDWLPTGVELQAHERLGPSAEASLAGECVRYGRPFTVIEVPQALLQESMRWSRRGNVVSDESLMRKPSEYAGSADPLASLRSLMSGLLDQQIGIKTLADMTGIKPRTLQRQLNSSGTSFTRLLDQVRFEVAAPLVCVAELPLTDIAYDLGFSDPAHFTRAFRRWTGVSPRDYRRTEMLKH